MFYSPKQPASYHIFLCASAFVQLHCTSSRLVLVRWWRDMFKHIQVCRYASEILHFAVELTFSSLGGGIKIRNFVNLFWFFSFPGTFLSHKRIWVLWAATCGASENVNISGCSRLILSSQLSPDGEGRFSFLYACKHVLVICYFTPFTFLLPCLSAKCGQSVAWPFCWSNGNIQIINRHSSRILHVLKDLTG